MRRKDREVTDFNEIVKIIDECDIVRLGLVDGGCSYIVPVNFAYEAQDETVILYIHGAMAGRKYELMTKSNTCSFEMDIPVKLDCMYEERNVTMRYKSVMGKAEIKFLDSEEKQNAIDNIIMARYDETRNFDYNKNALSATAVVKLTVTEISAKSNVI